LFEKKEKFLGYGKTNEKKCYAQILMEKIEEEEKDLFLVI